jgi:hypothetical protein
MNDQQKAFWDIIKTLHATHALEHVIVIGSWSEYMYQESGALNLRTSLKTQDMDLLVPNINKPREKIDLVAEFQKQGFELRQSQDGLIKLNKGGIIDLEFLVRQIGQGQNEPYKVHSLGVTAQGLRNMGILIDNTMTATANGYDVIVPRPEAYVLHKLAINENRKPDYKKERDMEAVKNVLKAINQNPITIGRLQETYNGLTRKQQLRVQNTRQKYDIDLPLLIEDHRN